jgi:flagellar hook assembly protein FlgD
LNKGKFEVMWDGKDANGNKVSTGIYFYTIQGEISGSKSGKIILTEEE